MYLTVVYRVLREQNGTTFDNRLGPPRSGVDLRHFVDNGQIRVEEPIAAAVVRRVVAHPAQFSGAVALLELRRFRSAEHVARLRFMFLKLEVHRGDADGCTPGMPSPHTSLFPRMSPRVSFPP